MAKILNAKKMAAKKIMEDEIKEAVIQIQAKMADVTNKMVGFATEFGDDKSLASQLLWSKSISGTASKMTKVAKASLLDDKTPRKIKSNGYLFVVEGTPAKTVINTTMIKKLDMTLYNKIAVRFPKHSKPGVKLSITHIK